MDQYVLAQGERSRLLQTLGEPTGASSSLLKVSQSAIFFNDNGGEDLHRLLHLLGPGKVG